jgi:hypothetical protein
MPLHPLKLPPEARDLRRIVAMQRTLLKALCIDPLDPATINEAWLAGIWPGQTGEWIHRFCRKDKFSILEKLNALASAPLAERQILYSEFIKQNRVRRIFNSGGQFLPLNEVIGLSESIINVANQCFRRFYDFLGANGEKWRGYEFPRQRVVSKASYKDSHALCNRLQPRPVTVCAFCDGPLIQAQLDHYYHQSTFPLLSVSPWNLVPICGPCNDMNGGKGNQPMLSLGAASPTQEWLHPYIRPAGLQIEIRLSGSPNDSIPRLHSPDANEQMRLDNHLGRIPSLQTRWTIQVFEYFNRVVLQVQERVANGAKVNDIVEGYLIDKQQSRGSDFFALAHAAVCKAILDRRPQYHEELSNSNRLTLS